MADPTTPAPVVDDSTKKPWLSKTLWMNLIMAVAAFIPAASDFITSHAALILTAWSVVNFVLRLVTKDAISLQD